MGGHGAGGRPVGSADDVYLTFRAIAEDQPGPKLRAQFERCWPSYREWFLREGESVRPSYAVCLRMLRTHMPELVPVYERLIGAVDGDDQMARFLSLYSPTPFLAACSQAMWTRGARPALLRNYDYRSHLLDGVILKTRYTGTRVIAMADCSWGALDGINEHGLAVSLAFGGRRPVGPGFGIALIVRYLLETCTTTREAAAVLRRVPVQMAYNVAVLDREARHLTAFIAPDREPVITAAQVSTNRQGAIDWPEHARIWATVEREQALVHCVADGQGSLDQLTRAFLTPPVYRATHAGGWGTLYTSRYLPREGAMECLWPDRSWRLGFDDFVEGEQHVRYVVRAAAHPAGPA